jgi:hypothetical protein
VVIAPAETEPSLREAILRVTAELTAAGFRVAAGSCAPGLECRLPAALARTRGRWPPVDFAWSAGSLAIETGWRAPPTGGPCASRTVVAGTPAPEPSVVAVRTTELVRAGVLAATRGRGPSRGQRPRAPGGIAFRRRGRRGIFVGVGPALVHSGLGTGWGFSLRAGYEWSAAWFAAGWLAMPAFGGDVSTAVGKAELRSEIGGIEAGRRWLPGRRVRPL